MLDPSASYIDRSTKDLLWMSGVSFYKKALSKPDLLRQELMINFESTGEVAADSGALRKEFFEDILEEANL